MKKIHPLIQGTCKVLREDYGKEKAARTAARGQRYLEKLERDNEGDPDALKEHTFKRIYPGIAVYKAMRREQIPKEKAVWYLREYFQRYCKAPAAVIRGMLKTPGLYKKIPSLFLGMSQKSFGEDAGFAYRFPELAEGETGFDIVRCPYMKTCLRYHCPEICIAFCDSDDATYGNMHPKLIWGRTQTIGHGAEYCDFRLTLKK